MIQMIMAISDNDVIGINNKLPWRIPFDLQWFKMNTYHSACIMGRKTWESLPFPLPGRLNIVLSKSVQSGLHPKCKYCSTIEQAIVLALEYSTNVYVIGGSEIYTQFLLARKIHTLILTRVHTKIYPKDNLRRISYMSLPINKKMTYRSALFKYKDIGFHFEIYRL